MKEYYIEKLNTLKQQLEITENHFNMTSGSNTKDKKIDSKIDILILRMDILEKQISNIYSEAKLSMIG